MSGARHLPTVACKCPPDNLKAKTLHSNHKVAGVHANAAPVRGGPRQQQLFAPFPERQPFDKLADPH